MLINTKGKKIDGILSKIYNVFISKIVINASLLFNRDIHVLNFVLLISSLFIYYIIFIFANLNFLY